jgi:hypothetical protein
VRLLVDLPRDADTHLGEPKHILCPVFLQCPVDRRFDCGQVGATSGGWQAFNAAGGERHGLGRLQRYRGGSGASGRLMVEPELHLRLKGVELDRGSGSDGREIACLAEMSAGLDPTAEAVGSTRGLEFGVLALCRIWAVPGHPCPALDREFLFAEDARELAEVSVEGQLLGCADESIADGREQSQAVRGQQAALG